jgi:hypothetical protein
MPSFYGKYRGTVTNNRDPKGLGRVQVSAPAVLGEGRRSWAMPSVPYAGPMVGWVAIPPEGANIWVEFEGGHPDYPIWSGCFWGNDEMPHGPAIPEVKLFKTEGMTLRMADGGEQKGFTLTLDSPATTHKLTLTMTDAGIALHYGDSISFQLTNDVIEVVRSDKASIKLTDDAIEIVCGDKTSIKVMPQEIAIDSSPLQIQLLADDKKLTIANGAVQAQFTSDKAVIQQGSAQIQLSPSGIELASSPATIKLSPSGIDAACSAAQITVGASEIELSNGAASVTLSPASVNINNGALEVM